MHLMRLGNYAINTPLCVCVQDWDDSGWGSRFKLLSAVFTMETTPCTGPITFACWDASIGVNGYFLLRLTGFGYDLHQDSGGRKD